MAANYATEDRINYRKGSPEEHGIADNSSVDRILVTGTSSQIAEQQEALSRLPPHLRDLAIYASDDSGLAVQQIELLANIEPISVPALPKIELEGDGHRSLGKMLSLKITDPGRVERSTSDTIKLS